MKHKHKGVRIWEATAEFCLHRFIKHFCRETVVVWKMLPYLQFLKPQNVILFSKKDSAVMIKLRILKWVNYLRLSVWVLNAITCILIKERQRGIWHRQKRRHCNYEGRNRTVVVTNQVIPAHTRSQKRQRGKGRTGFWSTPAEGWHSANTLVSAQWN